MTIILQSTTACHNAEFETTIQNFLKIAGQTSACKRFIYKISLLYMFDNLVYRCYNSYYLKWDYRVKFY